MQPRSHDAHTHRERERERLTNPLTQDAHTHTHTTHARARVKTHTSLTVTVGPSYPQGVSVVAPAPAEHLGFYVVATNNKEDVWVAKLPYGSF